MKTNDELRHAHDLFRAIYTGHVPSPWSGQKAIEVQIQGALMALGWALGLDTDEARSMENGIETASEYLRARGFRANRTVS